MPRRTGLRAVLAWPCARVCAWVCAWFLALGATPAAAGSFSVLPTKVQLASDRGVQSVLLTNTSSTTMTVESQVVVWPEDAAGQQPSDVVVTPAVVTLPPGQRMRVRIGLLRPSAGGVERAYRLYFTELASPAPIQGAAIGVRLRVGIPVFVAPEQDKPQALRFKALRLPEAETDAGAGWAIEAYNPGNVHARLAAPVLANGAQQWPLQAMGLHVLAGRTLRLNLPPGTEPSPGMRVRWKDGDDALDGLVAPH